MTPYYSVTFIRFLISGQFSCLRQFLPLVIAAVLHETKNTYISERIENV